jgi:hypothetical protein
MSHITKPRGLAVRATAPSAQYQCDFPGLNGETWVTRRCGAASEDDKFIFVKEDVG